MSQTTEQAQLAPPPLSRSEQINERNAQRRKEHLQLLELHQQALTDGDLVSADRYKRQADALFAEEIQRNTGLAMIVALKFTRNMSGDDSEDVKSAATIGLIRAYQLWDPDRGTLGNFSRSYIQGEVQRAVKLIERPNHSYNDYCANVHIEAVVQELVKEARAAGRDNYVPNHDEVAARSGRTKDQIRRVRQQRELRLDAPAGGPDSGSTFADIIPDALTAADPFGPSEWETQAEFDARLNVALQPLPIHVVWRVLRETGIDGAPPEPITETRAAIDLGREKLRRDTNKGWETSLEPAGFTRPCSNDD